MGKAARSDAMDRLITVVDGELAADGYKRVVTVQKAETIFAQYFSKSGGVPAVVTFCEESAGAEAIIYKDGAAREIKHAPDPAVGSDPRD